MYLLKAVGYWLLVKSQQTTFNLFRCPLSVVRCLLLTDYDIYNLLRNDDDFLDTLVGDPFHCFR